MYLYDIMNHFNAGGEDVRMESEESECFYKFGMKILHLSPHLKRMLKAILIMINTIIMEK